MGLGMQGESCTGRGQPISNTQQDSRAAVIFGLKPVIQYLQGLSRRKVVEGLRMVVLSVRHSAGVNSF